MSENPFVGWQGTLFGLGLARISELALQAQAQAEASLTPDAQKEIEKIRNGIKERNNDAVSEIHKLTNLGLIQATMLSLAKLNQVDNARIDELLATPKVDAFRWFVEQTGNKISEARTSTSTSILDTVQKLTPHKTLNYHLIYADRVDIMRVIGQHSELVISVPKDKYPRSYPTSQSADQALQYALYAPTTVPELKGATVEIRLAWFEANDGKFWENSGATNGIGAIQEIKGETPESWLKKNPLQVPNVKK